MTKRITVKSKHTSTGTCKNLNSNEKMKVEVKKNHCSVVMNMAMGNAEKTVCRTENNTYEKQFLKS